LSSRPTFPERRDGPPGRIFRGRRDLWGAVLLAGGHGGVKLRPQFRIGRRLRRDEAEALWFRGRGFRLLSILERRPCVVGPKRGEVLPEARLAQ
jgi:hypothetical protein